MFKKLIFTFILCYLASNNNLHAMWSGGWVHPIVEKVAQQFDMKTPTIYQQMRSARLFNPSMTPTCTGIGIQWGNLVIGDRLIEKLNAQEMELLITKAFIHSKYWYTSKKIALLASLGLLNMYVFSTLKNQNAPIKAAALFVFDALAYFGFSIYVEKTTDREALKITGNQEVLESAYRKISPNRWPSFYKNIGRYLGL